ncbi:hypothetical protein YC2023_045937 [Brassica napus]
MERVVMASKRVKNDRKRTLLCSKRILNDLKNGGEEDVAISIVCDESLKEDASPKYPPKLIEEVDN